MVRGGVSSNGGLYLVTSCCRLLLLLLPSFESLKSFCVNKQKQSPIGDVVVVAVAVISLATANADATSLPASCFFMDAFFVYRQQLQRGLCAAHLRLKKYKSKIFMRPTQVRTEGRTDWRTDERAVGPFPLTLCPFRTTVRLLDHICIPCQI